MSLIVQIIIPPRLAQNMFQTDGSPADARLPPLTIPHGTNTERREDRCMAIPLLDLKAQYATIRQEIRAALDRVLDSQRFILGPEVEALEHEIAAYSQCRYAIGVSSGTDALLAALMAIDIQPGDEVITSPYTFFASVGSIARLGARPVFVDIDPQTYTLDPPRVEDVISPQTRAIIPVHLFGQMVDMDPLLEIAARRNLFLIEDAAQAVGAEYKGKRAGSLGHCGCLSFFPSKNLGGYGDGGMVTTNDADLAQRVRQLRSHGAQSTYEHTRVGGNFRLDTLQAVVLRVKLPHLDAWTSARQHNADTYRLLFAAHGLGEISLPVEAAQRRHVYHQFVLQSTRRDALFATLQGHGIGAAIYYPTPMHLQPCFASLGYRRRAFPHSEYAAAHSLALPIYPELTPAMQEEVVRTIAAFHRN